MAEDLSIDYLSKELKLQPQSIRYRCRRLFPNLMAKGKNTKLNSYQFETIKNFLAIQKKDKFEDYIKRGKTVDPNIRREIIKRDGEICQYCGKDTNGSITIDHIHPISKKGNDDISNLIVCCKKCNSIKSNNVLEDFRVSLLLNKFDYRINFKQYNHLLTKGIDLLEGVDKSFYFERFK